MMREMVGGCCVCSDERGWADNPLVYCDGHGCNVAVHQACYGIIAVPTGPWFCRKCESQERAARVRCELCPQKEGALKKTDTQGWCHVLCALYVPEAWFGNVQTMEPIVLKGVPAERFNKLCYICEESGRVGKATTGACMQCNKSGCKQYFHVTCAQSQGLLCEESGSYMDNVRYCGYCKYHYKKLKKDSNLKVIPAFKSSATEGGGTTPDSSPEKGPSLQLRSDRQKLRDRSVKGMTATSTNAPSSSRIATVPSPSGSIDAATPSSNGGSASTGKFTTANFVETTITPSPASFKRGGGDTDRADNSGSETDCSRSGSDHDSSGSSTDSSSSESDGESGRLSTKAKTKVETKEATVVKAAISADAEVKADPKKVAKSSAAPVATPVAVTKEGGDIITPPAPPAYSYCFENFLTRNMSGTQAAQGAPASQGAQSTAQKSASTPPPGEETQGKQHAEKKKAKKSRSLPEQGMVNGKVKGAKETLRQSLPQDGTAGPSKKSTVAPVKRKRTVSRSETTKSTAKALKLTPPPVATARQPPAKKTVPIKESKLGSLSSNPFAAHIAATNTTATGTFSDAFVSCAGSAASSSTSSSPGLITKKTTPSSASSSSSPLSSNITNQIPSSMEQLLERHWEQGSQFLVEQGQHFDLASLLNCLQQLRQENHHLEEHINMLTSRRDQLLAVNARLSHAPAVVTNSLAPGLAAGHLGSVVRGVGVTGRSPRVVNNALGHVETNNTQSSGPPWNPLLGEGPLQHSPGSSRGSSQLQSPEKHTPTSLATSHTPPKHAPPLTGSPSRAPPPAEQHKWMMQNMPGMRGPPFPLEHQAMYQMLQQQQHHRALPFNPSAAPPGAHTGLPIPPPAKSAAYAMLSQSMPGGRSETKPGGDKT